MRIFFYVSIMLVILSIRLRSSRSEVSMPNLRLNARPTTTVNSSARNEANANIAFFFNRPPHLNPISSARTRSQKRMLSQQSTCICEYHALGVPGLR